MDSVASSSTADSTAAATSAGSSSRSGRRGRSGNGGGRTRTPRKETGGQAASSRQHHSNSQDEGDVWETPALGDERKEALNWQQTLASPQPKGNVSGTSGRARKQRPALPASAASAPPVPGQHVPFVELARQAAHSGSGEAPTWQQALFKAPAPSSTQASRTTTSLPAGVLNIVLPPPSPAGKGGGGKNKRQRGGPSTSAEAPSSLPSHSLHGQAQTQLPSKHMPPHLVPPPTAPPAMRSASLPAEDAGAMYAGPDYHSSPAAEDLPRPRFPPRVR